MTPSTVTAAFIEAREIQRVADDVVHEARCGLTAVRIVAGWRIAVDRTPPGAWVITAEVLSRDLPYPMMPPALVAIHLAQICLVAGAPANITADAFDDALDLVNGKFTVTWHETETAA